MIAIKKNNEYKVANYGQWDWYPSGQWLSLLKILSEIDIGILSEKVDLIRPITEAELDEIPDTPDWPELYPWLSRDAWADIITHIMNDKLILRMDHINLKPNIWIEWSYLIDLDNNTFSMFKDTICNDKWVQYNSPMACYKLDELPTEEVWKERFKGF